MKWLLPGLLPLLLLGCAGAHKQGVSMTDPFEGVRIEQMSGNAVSGRVFERTILCLNARREVWPPRPTTNLTVSLVTNLVVTQVTNRVVTLSTNQSATLSTNLAPRTEHAAVRTAPEQADSFSGEPSGPDTPLSAPTTTNDTASVTHNVSIAHAPHQISRSTLMQLSSSRQVTHATNDLSLTSVESRLVTLETNEVVVALSNSIVVPQTNVTVVTPAGPRCEYFLYTELTPPADFVPLVSGESLVLLVDGVRYGLVATNLQTGFKPRRGFTTAFYRVGPDLIEAIASARQVRIRIRGLNGVIEREMSRASRANFREFLRRCAAADLPGPVNAPAGRPRPKPRLF